ncbi:MAG: hypothetical protein NC413_00255 [Muribaculum sp.]|nr:hypothetical protein [Muribaculum sp.]
MDYYEQVMMVSLALFMRTPMQMNMPRGGAWGARRVGKKAFLLDYECGAWRA